MLLASTLCALAPAAVQDTPRIELWHGRQLEFGARGHPQRWVNVLGTVTDPDGVESLVYRLNGSAPRPLTVGPDGRRLLAPGDFNVELDRAELEDGRNELTLVATDTTGATGVVAVDLSYHADGAWPQDDQLDWATVDEVTDAVQVVDGRWRLTPDGLRTVDVGYDRLVALGEDDWTDYEVLVPITVHAVDERAWDDPVSNAPAVAIDLRWRGHTDLPVRCGQPRCGWEPGGASNLFEWRADGPDLLHVFADPLHYPYEKSARTDDVALPLGERTWFRARVETTAAGHLYSLKVWSDTAPEPADWTLQRVTTLANLARGAILLKAHHVDVTFGPLTVLSLADVGGMSWARVTKVTSVLARSPLFLVALAAAGLALARRRDAPRTAGAVLTAALLLGLAATLDVLLELKLPALLESGGWTSDELTVGARLGELVRTALVALAVALLVVRLVQRDTGRGGEDGA